MDSFFLRRERNTIGNTVHAWKGCASVFWVGLGLSCGPVSGQLGSENVLSGVEAWMVPCSGTCRSLKTSLGPGEAQERPTCSALHFSGCVQLG